jgi:hypothetical protein
VLRPRTSTSGGQSSGGLSTAAAIVAVAAAAAADDAVELVLFLVAAAQSRKEVQVRQLESRWPSESWKEPSKRGRELPRVQRRLTVYHPFPTPRL